MKTLILAGGYDQIRLINEFKNRDYETILVDYYENPPAKSYAHKHYQVSTLDVEAVKKIAIEEKVDLVMTACTDQALATMAKISEELKLPCYLSYDTALKVTNKQLMKNIMVQNNIPTAKHQIVKSSGEIGHMSYPLVVKPLDANSSKGVTRVYDRSGLDEAVVSAKTYSRCKEVLVEEFKQGEELSVDVWVSDGRAKLLCVSQSVKKKDKKSFTIIQSKYPCNIHAESEIVDIANRIAQVFSIDDGPMLIQMISTPEGCFVIEFSARFGGGTKYKLIDAVSGIDSMGALVDLSVGKKFVGDIRRTNGHIHMNYVYCDSGMIGSFEGFEEALEQKVIDDFFYYKTPGMEIEKIENSSDRAAGYMVSGDTLEELILKEKKAEDMIAVRDCRGKNIIRGLLYE
ncbi:MAG: ATP-grasp domain-containing protein [Lachnospiraceae bacterium]|nr:ATP-grasp domain-containing protein [Lachnospiraceae bacterium]